MEPVKGTAVAYAAVGNDPVGREFYYFSRDGIVRGTGVKYGVATEVSWISMVGSQTRIPAMLKFKGDRGWYCGDLCFLNRLDAYRAAADMVSRAILCERNRHEVARDRLEKSLRALGGL